MKKRMAVAVLALLLNMFAVAEQSAQPDALPMSPGAISSAPLLSMLAPMAPVAPQAEPAPAPEREAHRFWDKRNLIVFGALAAARTLDPISTWQFRRQGFHEGQLSDGFVDNKPLFAVYSAALVAGQISTSYVFHRLGWHKVERISALVHTGAVSEAVIHNYRLKH